MDKKLAGDMVGAIQLFQSMNGICLIFNSAGESHHEDLSRWYNILDRERILQFDLPLHSLVENLTTIESQVFDAIDRVKPNLIGIIGIPRISVFELDIAGICRSVEEKFGITSIAIGCGGRHFYDDSMQEIYLALMFRLTEAQQQKKKYSLGVLGVTPFDFDPQFVDELHRRYTRKGWQKIVCFGLEGGLEIFRDASSIEENLVVAPSGFPAAKFLQKTFGIPFHIDYPLFMSEMPIHISEKPSGYRKILIVHQQFKANSFRHWLQTQYSNSRIVVASFFMMQNYLCQPHDRRLKSRDDFTKMIKHNNFDCVLADPMLKESLPKNWAGDFFEMPHVAISKLD